MIILNINSNINIDIKSLFYRVRFDFIGRTILLSSLSYSLSILHRLPYDPFYMNLGNSGAHFFQSEAKTAKLEFLD